MQKNKVITGRFAAAAVSAILAAAAVGGYVIPAAPTFPAVAAETSPSESSSEVSLNMGLSAGGSKIGISFYLTLEGDRRDYVITLDNETQEPEETEQGWLITTDEYAMNMKKPHRVIVSKGGEVLLDQSVSVSDYLHTLLAGSEYSSYHDLAKAMLRYGGAAQAYFGVDATEPFDDDIEGAEISGVAINSEVFDKDAFNAQLDGKAVSYYGMNLSLRSETSLTLYFKCSDGASMQEAKDFIEGFTFNGNAVTAVANGQSFVTVSLDIPATGISKDYAFTNGSITADFNPCQYLAAACADDDEKLANVCKALYAYGKAASEQGQQQQQEELQWLLEPKGTVHTGEATYYSLSDENLGNAMLNDVRGDHYYAAMNTADYDNAMLAGAYVEVTGPKGSVDVYIVDRLPEGAKGDIDLDPKAFEKIADKSAGRVNVTWKIIPFDDAATKPMSYRLKTGASQWWFEMQVFGQRYPIYSFEVLKDGEYVTVPREEYNYFNYKGAMGAGPYTFRITDIYGHVVIDENVALTTPEEIVEGSAQFPL